jgi:hypothetical protein
LCRDRIAEVAESFYPSATYVTGRLVDRVAADGVLAAVQQPMGDSGAHVQSLFSQFPLTCDVANKLYKGWDTKVVAFRVSHELQGCGLGLGCAWVHCVLPG